MNYMYNVQYVELWIPRECSSKLKPDRISKHLKPSFLNKQGCSKSVPHYYIMSYGCLGQCYYELSYGSRSMQSITHCRFKATTH